jgi:hypothetical protein
LQAGQHPHLYFRGLLRLYSRYGPSICSTAQGGLCHEARLHYATAVISYNQAQINLLAALGLIDPANVEGKPKAAPMLSSPMELFRSAPK